MLGLEGRLDVGGDSAGGDGVGADPVALVPVKRPGMNAGSGVRSAPASAGTSLLLDMWRLPDTGWMLTPPITAPCGAAASGLLGS